MGGSWFSQAVRAEAAAARVQVNVLCPGYVDTKLIDEIFEPTAGYVRGRFRRNTRGLQPRLLTPTVVAQKAITGIERDKPVIVVGGFAHLSARPWGSRPRSCGPGRGCRRSGRSVSRAGDNRRAAPRDSQCVPVSAWRSALRVSACGG
ncbi:hypothetical protein BN13_1850004 [Nostocoides jenkinsii Ben 74]|uniref:Uncharacterized protein n=1 Tax=Nostocoides jenkinsii Ben 74 TaxID=1193518 RepID=A0A077M7N3_9MICO|nr:hypothetical protein BN13_1850004 [Tetrasphaera jenkinsii Ben 74]